MTNKRQHIFDSRYFETSWHLDDEARDGTSMNDEDEKTMKLMNTLIEIWQTGDLSYVVGFVSGNRGRILTLIEMVNDYQVTNNCSTDPTL